MFDKDKLATIGTVVGMALLVINLVFTLGIYFERVGAIAKDVNEIEDSVKAVSTVVRQNKLQLGEHELRIVYLEREQEYDSDTGRAGSSETVGRAALAAVP